MFNNLNLNQMRSAFTSVSLDTEALDKINQLGHHFTETLARLCLKKYLQKYVESKSTPMLAERATVQYNPSSATHILKIEFTAKEHHLLQTYRLILKRSVSFMLSAAALEFADRIARVLKRFSQSRTLSITHRRGHFYLLSLKARIRSVHRRLWRRGRGLLFLKIVIPTPNRGTIGLPGPRGEKEVGSRRWREARLL